MEADFSTHSTAAAGKDDGGSCAFAVVLTCGCDGDPSALIRALASRGLEPIVVRDAYEAMTRVAGVPARVLVVQDPGRQPMLDRLIAAMGRWHSRVELWAYSEVAGRGRVSPLVRRSSAALSPQPQRPSKPQRTPPGARANGSESKPVRTANGDANHDAVQDLAREADRDAARFDPPQLTQEELAMLLGPAEGDEDRFDEPAGPSLR